MNLDLEVKYFSNGPSFEKSANPSVLTCSPDDKSWFFLLPPVVAKEQ